MNKSESIKGLATALAKAQAEMPTAKMNAVNPFLKSKYADLGSIIEAARDALKTNGLSYSQLTVGGAEQIGITTILMHTSGEWLESTIMLPIGESKGKSQAQEAGSIITYLRRYSLASLLGIYADEDTDGNAPAKAASKPRQARAPEMPPAQTDNGNEKPENGRPYAPATLKEALRVAAKKYTNKGAAATDNERKVLAKQLTTLFDGDNTKRYEATKYLAGVASTKELSDGMVKAMLGKWLEVSSFDQMPNVDALAEAKALTAAALKAEGQQELL